MDLRRTLILLAAFVTVSTSGAGSANAIGFKTFNFTGLVNLVSDPLPVLNGSVVVGTPFSGSYTFDPGAPDADAFPASSRFSSDPSAGYGLILNIGSYVVKTEPSAAFFISVLLKVIALDGDQYAVTSNRNTGIDADPSSVSLVAVVADFRGPAGLLPSDALPLVLPPLSSFTVENRLLFFGLDTGGDPQLAFNIEGRFTALTSADISAVPEPTTLLLLSTTAAGIGLVRWKNRRQKQL